MNVNRVKTVKSISFEGINLKKQINLSENFIEELLESNIYLASSLDTLNFLLMRKKLDKKTYCQQKKIVLREIQQNNNLMEIHSINLNQLKHKLTRALAVKQDYYI